MDGGRTAGKAGKMKVFWIFFFSLIEAAVECEMERLLWANRQKRECRAVRAILISSKKEAYIKDIFVIPPH